MQRGGGRGETLACKPAEKEKKRAREGGGEERRVRSEKKV